MTSDIGFFFFFFFFFCIDLDDAHPLELFISSDFSRGRKSLVTSDISDKNRKTDQYRKSNKLRSENHKTKDVFVCMNRPKC